MEPRFRLAATALAVASLTAGLARGQAQPAAPTSDTDPALERGLVHYEQGNYLAAVEEFRGGYQRTGHPTFLFAIAQAQRLAGDCAAAIASYRQYLDTQPAEGHATAATTHIAACQRKMSRPPPREQTMSRSAPAGTVVVARAGARGTVRGPWYTDALGGALVAAGVMAAGVGTGFFVGAAADVHAAAAAQTYGEHSGLVERAHTRRVIAWSVMAASSALVAGAMLRYIFIGRTATPRLTAALSRRGAQLVLAGEF
jgi:hypothetical protein